MGTFPSQIHHANLGCRGVEQLSEAKVRRNCGNEANLGSSIILTGIRVFAVSPQPYRYDLTFVDVVGVMYFGWVNL